MPAIRTVHSSCHFMKIQNSDKQWIRVEDWPLASRMPMHAPFRTLQTPGTCPDPALFWGVLHCAIHSCPGSTLLSNVHHCAILYCSVLNFAASVVGHAKIPQPLFSTTYQFSASWHNTPGLLYHTAVQEVLHNYGQPWLTGPPDSGAWVCSNNKIIFFFFNHFLWL